MTQDERLKADWDRWQALEVSTPTDRRKAQERAVKDLNAALEALRELARAGGGYLMTDETGEPLASLAALTQIRDQIAAAEVTAVTPRGRCPNVPLALLVRRLARDFEHETVLKASVTHDPYSGTRGGAFVRYATARAATIGVTLQAHQLEHV